MAHLGLAQTDENLIRNGDFEDDITGWVFANFTKRFPDALAWEEKDTEGKSRGALKVTMPAPEALEEKSPWQTGAVCTLLGKLDPETEVIKIKFAAKSLDESPFLFITRLHGGGGGQSVELEPGWKKFEVIISTAHADNALVFTLIGKPFAGAGPGAGPGASPVAEGAFLLDNVEVTTAKKK
ncbi:MAG: hypothetical protein HY360_12815 [Verrucomicrobia bacterium]|nr:hypothetical protein [Verrucomicrobiota bacterium]